LQVPGNDEIGTIVTGVSASAELFERAAEEGADLVLVHHGLFWGETGPLDAQLKRRLKLLFDHDMALAAYHLPLDAHPEVGNNALICEALGLERAEPFGEHRGRSIGFVGRAEGGIELAELRERCRVAFGREPFGWEAGRETIRSVGIVSGGGASSFEEAIARGLDAFLTGEPAEPAMATAREAGVHFLACGHYATETLGVRRLGELLAKRFGVRHAFIDVPNPV
jgi:dinuclear metal center YbgI/SA1388 family protein